VHNVCAAWNVTRMLTGLATYKEGKLRKKFQGKINFLVKHLYYFCLIHAKPQT
jgi:hypothetical protein